MREEKRHIKRPRKRSTSRTALFDPLALGKQCDNPVIASMLAGITAPLAHLSADAVDAIRGYFDILLSRFSSEPPAQAEVSDEDLMFPMDDLPASSDGLLDAPDEDLLFRMDDLPTSSDVPLDALDEDLLFRMDDLPTSSDVPLDAPDEDLLFRMDDLPASSDVPLDAPDEDLMFPIDDLPVSEDRFSDEASSKTPSDHAASVLSAYYFFVSRWRVALQDPKRGKLTKEDLTLFSQLVGHALFLFRSVHGDITENLACYPQVQDLRQWEEETIDSSVGLIVSVSQPIPIPKRKQSQYAARSDSSVPSSYWESRFESWGRF